MAWPARLASRVPPGRTRDFRGRTDASRIVSPIVGAILAGFLIAAARDRLLGSWWIAWLGMAGGVGHGLAGPLVVLWGIAWARDLFVTIVLVAIWMIAASAWPGRRAHP